MKLRITTPEELIEFVRSTEIELNELNRILSLCLGSVFINDRTPAARAQYLEQFLQEYGNERPVFIDLDCLY